MTAAQRFADALREGSITPQTAASIFAERGLAYRPECVKAWVEGRVIPGLNVRFMLLVRVVTTPEDREYFSHVFSQHGPEESRPLVEKLCAAVRAGSMSAARASLDGGVVIDGWDNNNGCAIGYTAESSHTGMTELLMAYGASPMAFMPGTKTAWAHALLHGTAAQVRLFLSHGASLSMTDGDGHGVLELAALNHRKDPLVLRAVFEASRAAPVALSQPLRLAARAGNVEVMRQCLALGAPINSGGSDRRTALMAAAEAGAEGAARLLLENGAEIGLADRQGLSALHHAVLGKNSAVIQLLMATGADPNQVDASGKTPLDLARATPIEGLLAATLAKDRGPRWYQPEGEAILFHYSKAFGLGFDPSNRDRPILYGGDYNGMMPAVSSAFVDDPSVASELGQYGLTWFMAFAKKLARRENFALEELVAMAEANGFQCSKRR